MIKLTVRARMFIIGVGVVAASLTGCDDEPDILQDIERGRDIRPGIDASPPAEAN